jgi:hypothetical protein
VPFTPTKLDTSTVQFLTRAAFCSAGFERKKLEALLSYRSSYDVYNSHDRRYARKCAKGELQMSLAAGLAQLYNMDSY